MERVYVALVPGVVLSGSISEKAIQSGIPKYKGYKWECLTTNSALQDNTVTPKEILGLPGDGPPPPPPVKDKGGGGVLYK